MTEDERKNRNPKPEPATFQEDECRELKVADLQLHRVYIVQGESRNAFSLNYMGITPCLTPTLDAVLPAHHFHGPRGPVDYFFVADEKGELRDWEDTRSRSASTRGQTLRPPAPSAPLSRPACTSPACGGGRQSCRLPRWSGSGAGYTPTAPPGFPRAIPVSWPSRRRSAATRSRSPDAPLGAFGPTVFGAAWQAPWFPRAADGGRFDDRPRQMRHAVSSTLRSISASDSRRLWPRRTSTPFARPYRRDSLPGHRIMPSPSS